MKKSWWLAFVVAVAALAAARTASPAYRPY